MGTQGNKAPVECSRTRNAIRTRYYANGQVNDSGLQECKWDNRTSNATSTRQIMQQRAMQQQAMKQQSNATTSNATTSNATTSNATTSMHTATRQCKQHLANNGKSDKNQFFSKIKNLNTHKTLQEIFLISILFIIFSTTFFKTNLSKILPFVTR